MISLRVAQLDGSELPVLEVQESMTVLELKAELEIITSMRWSEQNLLWGTEVLPDEAVLGEVEGINEAGSMLTLLREVQPPWCWPVTQLDAEPGVLHHMFLYEDPEVSVSKVTFHDFWDPDDDVTTDVEWRKRGFRLTPSIGPHAGVELEFTQGLDGNHDSFTFNGKHQKCSNLCFTSDCPSWFVKRCLQAAMDLNGSRVWPKEWLERATMPEDDFGDLALVAEVSALGDDAGICFQVPKSASFAELHHLTAAVLFRRGYMWPEGFTLWTQDGTFLLPVSVRKCCWQAYLHAPDGSFRLVAVPRSTQAVAVAGVGIYPKESAPAKQAGVDRVGIALFPWEKRSTAKEQAGLRSLWTTVEGVQETQSAVLEVGLTRSKIRRASATGWTRDDLAKAAWTDMDDFSAVDNLEKDAILQLFEVRQAGAVYTKVRVTSDGNMCGGSHRFVPVPAHANSRVVHAYLSSLLIQSPSCSRLAGLADHTSGIEFDELSEVSKRREFEGLCICEH